jgi:hypothetical protein
MPNPHEITLDQAVALTQRFKNNHPSGTKRGFLINKEELTELFAQDDAAGIRIYLGEKENHEYSIVAVATDAEGNDLTTIVMDMFHPCPDQCSADSPL